MATESTQRDAAAENTETGSQDTQTNGQETTVGGTPQVTDSSSTEDNGTATSQGTEGDTTTGGSTEQTPSPKEEQLLADLVKERGRRQALSTQVEQLEAAAKAAQSSEGEFTALQSKYNRLESFLTSVGGPLSKALDSRSFTKALFESDEDITDLVAKWHKDNPSATSSALNSGSGSTKPSSGMNDLLRKAAQ